MKKSIKLALLAALGLALAGLNAQAQTEPAAPAPAQPPGGPPHGPPRLEQLLAHLLEKYDTNRDGILDQNELAALRKDIEEGKIGPPPGGPGMRGPAGPEPGRLPKEILDKYDVNKDGKLDETERAALHKDIQDGKVQLPPPWPGLRGPGGPALRPPPTAKEILDRFDVDKDGKLDETELAAFLKDMQQHRPPHPGHGPMGGPPWSGPPPDGGPSGGLPPDGAPQQQ